MNVYDFDKTIYDGDSTVHFVLYCLKRKPALLRYFPRTGAAYFRYYVLHRGTKTEMKQVLYRMLQSIPDIDAWIEAFWDAHIGGIKPWYMDLQREDDVIISASPLFLVQPACDRLGIRVCMASDVDRKTGVYMGINCHGEEKVRRFYERFPAGEIEEFYSDSLSDTPLARIANAAFLVKGDELLPWPSASLGGQEKP